ncbi:MAG: SoxR reducing system RseC family protein [Chitinivibrionia bacterium]|nr:SoxR reducing system RseC family protein [Chitinivibrionia bacterium]
MWKKYAPRAGKIIEIGKEKIKVELFSKELPSACKAKGCNACQTYSPQIIRDYSKSDFACAVAINDIVKIESCQINDGLAATTVFLTPLLFSAIFYHISYIIGIDSEDILSIFFAIFGAIFGFFIVVVFDKIFRKLNPTKIFKE